MKYTTQANPHVYDMFCKFTSRARNAGFKRYSANAIFERIRWHMDVEINGDVFKMNNNYRAFYARKFMENNRGCDGFFETREQRNLK